ncbi:uncharacterized protein KZ484_000263 [Pholidichthys leucotaenia]
MLETYTKALVKKTGAQNFFPRKDLTKEANLLTLVKIKQRSRNTFLYPVTTKVEIIQKDLPSLIGEDGFSPVYDEELVVSNFKWSKGRKRAGKVAGGYHEVETEVTLSIDAVDGMKNSVDIMKKTVNIDKLEWKVRKDVLDTLGLKNDDKLAFIYQIMYSTVPWELSKKSNTEGIFKASLKKLLHISGKGSEEETEEFTVPENKTLAYELKEIKIENDKFKIVGPWPLEQKFWAKYVSDNPDGDSCESLRKVKEELMKNEGLLNPLADLPTRCDLLKNLREIIKDKALTLLEETMYAASEGEFECPESQVVSSFLKLLKETPSNISTSTIKIPVEVAAPVEMLVTSLDNLPGDMASLLTNCSPDTLSVLNQLVDKLKGDSRVQLPEPLPLPLQEEGEMYWAVTLLCLSNETMGKLSDFWDQLDYPPEILLQALCLSVRGLNLMQ